MTVSEERDELQKLLRKACRTAAALPKDVQAWWDVEQMLIAEEQAQADTRKVEKASELRHRISDLQAQLAKLA